MERKTAQEIKEICAGMSDERLVEQLARYTKFAEYGKRRLEEGTINPELQAYNVDILAALEAELLARNAK